MPLLLAVEAEVETHKQILVTAKAAAVVLALQVGYL
jgi:hypothetical protein